MAPAVEFSVAGPVIRVPDRSLVFDAAIFDDELYAYLMFGYFRGLVARDGYQAWLTCERKDGAIAYVIRLGRQDNLYTALPYLLRLHANGIVTEVSYHWVVAGVVSRYAAQSRTFDRVYNFPTHRKLELLPRPELASYVRRFIRFKASTDGRVRGKSGTDPRPPGPNEAHRLAEDIVSVADFFSLPLDFFLGIGAMENNYLHVKGDLGNTVWKRRAHNGDIILKRGRKGVLVLNESSGIWQITRETLRQAHRLFQKDTRNYSLLPEHLRPPRKLDLNDVPPAVLTTYAGLFFRDLLDRFNGNVTTAVAAYNGGPGNPNLRYEAGVRLIAQQARRILEQAATLQGRAVPTMSFLAATR